jgi:hypothetical protein
MAATIKVQGATELVVALDKATSRMIPEVSAVLGKAGGNMKNDIRARWSGMRHLPKLPGLVSYDVFPWVGGIYVEVGPAHVGQGELAVFAEFGSVNNAPRPALAPALDAEAPKVEAALDALLGKLLDGA